MTTHNIAFYEDLTKIIFELSSNTHLISSAANATFVVYHFYDVVYLQVSDAYIITLFSPERFKNKRTQIRNFTLKNNLDRYSKIRVRVYSKILNTQY